MNFRELNVRIKELTEIGSKLSESDMMDVVAAVDDLNRELQAAINHLATGLIVYEFYRSVNEADADLRPLIEAIKSACYGKCVGLAGAALGLVLKDVLTICGEEQAKAAFAMMMDRQADSSNQPKDNQPQNENGL